MKTQSFVKLLWKVIREEVRSAVKEILVEQPTYPTDSISLTETSVKPRGQKKYTKNPILNNLLNETAATPASKELSDWSTINFKSEMADAFGVKSKPQQLASTGINGEAVNMNNDKVATTVNAMTKDYSALMKAIDKKKGK